MPGEDGYALIKQVRILEDLHGMQISAAALTAHAKAEDRLRALAAGFDTHIAKPVEPTELVAVIISLARRARRTRGEEGGSFMNFTAFFLRDIHAPVFYRRAFSLRLLNARNLRSAVRSLFLPQRPQLPVSKPTLRHTSPEKGLLPKSSRLHSSKLGSYEIQICGKGAIAIDPIRSSSRRESSQPSNGHEHTRGSHQALNAPCHSSPLQ